MKDFNDNLEWLILNTKKGPSQTYYDGKIEKYRSLLDLVKDEQAPAGKSRSSSTSEHPPADRGGASHSPGPGGHFDM